MQKQFTLTYRWFDEVWNRGIENAIDKYLDTGAVVHGIEGISESGPEGFKVFYREFRREFSDINVDVEEVVAENGFESSRCNVSAKHIASGQTVHFTGQTTIRVQNDKITEGWNNFDFLSMYKQLGFSLTSAMATATN
jgi:predicted ester cyclase